MYKQLQLSHSLLIHMIIYKIILPVTTYDYKNKKCEGATFVYISFYIIQMYFTFLFSLFVIVSAAGQYNVIWTETGLPRFRFGSGTVPALLF
jgi:hypothetical protein